MAYNTVKGNVHGSVDQHGDQEIDGIKVFKNVLSASVFYDTDAQSPCATMKDVALTEIRGGRPSSVLTYDGGTSAVAQHNMMFDGETLQVKNIVTNNVAGPGPELRELPSDQFTSPIGAAFIHHGAGLTAVRDSLQVNVGAGLRVSIGGELETAITSKSGLSTNEAGLYVNPSAAPAINIHGQNLSDDDSLLVWDTSHGALRHTTLSNLYEKYVHLRMPKASGHDGEIQFKTKIGFGASTKLSYDKPKETLKVGGTLDAHHIKVEETLTCAGAVYHNIKTVTDPEYDVTDDDYTILCNAVKNQIIVNLPAACNNRGRMLIIKKTNTDKYSIKSHPVRVRVSEGTIDINDERVMKMNYSSRILQSDGTNWWVVGAKGT